MNEYQVRVSFCSGLRRFKEIKLPFVPLEGIKLAFDDVYGVIKSCTWNHNMYRFDVKLDDYE